MAGPPCPWRLGPLASQASGDVHIYDTNDHGTVLGGLTLTNGVTNANFYLMVEIIFIFDSFYFLRDEGGTIVERDDHPLQSGNYYIVTAGKFLTQLHDQLVSI